MRAPWRIGAVSLSVVAATLTGAMVGTSSAQASTVVQDAVVSSVPASWTPRVNDGAVLTIVQVGDQVVLGGSFTSVSGRSGSPTYARPYIVAFNATTGAINTGFAPTLNGNVNKVVPGPLPGTVIVGGAFSQVNGTNERVVLLNLSNGSINTTFNAPAMNGQVRDMKSMGNRLYVGGLFTVVGGQAHAGLAGLNYTTGALDPFVNNQFSVNHNWYAGCTDCAKAGTGVSYLDVSADGSTLIATGNFKVVDGLTRDQIVNISLAGSSAVVRADWNTNRYTPRCAYRAFDTYMRGVALSPDGSYFVVVATGAPNSGTLCDAAARFETSVSSSDAQPTWVNYSGGDTFMSVEITGSAVYTGGHMRWMNNPLGGDSARAGSVPRPGLNALDPVSGVPMSWNPGRNPRGEGASALYATPSGLWVGSDTDWIGNFDYLRPKVAFFPLAGGTTPPAGRAMSLPSDVYLGGPLSGGSSISRRTFDGSTVGGTTPAPDGGITWANVRGAIQIDNMLYYGSTDGFLHRRTFDGTNYGSDEALDPYHDPYWCPVPTGSGTSVYCGVSPSLYGQLSNVNAMAYGFGRLYYTLSNQSGLFYRSFSPESGIVGETTVTVPGTTAISGARALLVSGGSLYYASTSNGSLSRIAFGPSGVSGSATVVSTLDWRARAVFMAPGPGTPPPNQTPVASFTASCSAMTCTFNGGASHDPDGSIASYTWDFGDGQTSAGTGQPGTVSNTYANAVTHTVRLTVTDNQGATSSAQSVVSPTPPAAPVATFTSNCTQLECSFDASGSTTGAPPLTYAWTWGDSTPGGSEVSPTHSYARTGTYNVTLTVTDALNRTASASQQVAVGQPSANITYVAGSSSNRNTATARVTVPQATQAGDGMLLFVSAATSPTLSTPSGWTLVDQRVSNKLVTNVYSRTATAGDAGSNVDSTAASTLKVVMNLQVYRGTADGAFATATSQPAGNTSTRVAPAVEISTAGSWVVSYWADKSDGSTTAWSTPASVTVRDTSFGSGGGAMSSAIGDSNGTVPIGTYAARTATSNASAPSGIGWSVVLRPGPTGPIGPTADFSSACDATVCSFDGTASTAGTGSITGYLWSFGDDGTSTEPTPSHTYAGPGQYDVSLTVTQTGGLTDTASRSITVTVAPTGAITFVGRAGFSGQTQGPSVTVPAATEAGDGMVLVLTHGSDAITFSTPSGWAEVGRFTQGTNLTTAVYRRTAAAGDAGTNVGIPYTGGFAKSTLEIVVYRGTAAGAFVAATGSGSGSGSSRTAPAVSLDNSSSWVISYWADRSSGSTTSWTAPADVTVRGSLFSSGGGATSSLLADSNGAVPAGTYAARTAMSNADAGKGLGITVVVSAA